MDTLPLDDQIAALEEGRAYLEHSDVILTVVSGADARSWLHDLVTADVATLEPFQTRPSLLLSPTGKIRATFHLLGLEHDFLLAQPADQPAQIAALLASYILSSDVALGTSPLQVFSVPSLRATPPWISEGWRPGIHDGGVDLLVAEDDRSETRERFARSGFVAADLAAVETMRIRRGIPRFPVDLDEDSLPAEADLEQTIDLTKGCFLGQESVAKVRNLGHPARVVLPLRAAEPASAGERVLAGGDEVGLLTSVAPVPGGSAVLARVRWSARGSDDLRTGAGAALRPS
jgi:tRNA-modifying protein YgfZ